MTQVTIIPLERLEQTTTFQLGEMIPELSDGTARWRQVDRPRRRSITEYEGENLLRVTFEIIIDQFPDGDVEPLIGRVMAWGARVALPYQPPRLKFQGPIMYADLTWVLDKVDHVAPVAYRNDGRRCRQTLRLTLLEYNAPMITLYMPKPPAEAAQERARTSKMERISGLPAKHVTDRVHTVRRGDTLWAIAQRLLGAGKRWQEIADINGIRDPKTLQVGTNLRIPNS